MNWDKVRKGTNSEELRFLDYRLLEDVEADRCYLTDTGKSMRDGMSDDSFRRTPVSMRKIIALGLVSQVARGERYRLTEAGAEALQAWRDSRANPSH